MTKQIDSLMRRFSIVFVVCRDNEVQITAEKPPITPATAVSDFETLIGSSLPSSFREFILHYGDAYLRGNIKHVPSSIGINVFYGLREISRDNATRIWQIYRDRLPEGLIPITSDPGGNQICIQVLGPHIGQIVWWCSTDECPLEVIAPSFEDFLEGLRDVSR